MSLTAKRNILLGKSNIRKGKKALFYGKTHSIESRRKIGKASKGRKLSEEHKRKISKSLKGRTHREESKQKMSEVWRKKKILSNLEKLAA